MCQFDFLSVVFFYYLCLRNFYFHLYFVQTNTRTQFRVINYKFIEKARKNLLNLSLMNENQAKKNKVKKFIEYETQINENKWFIQSIK